MCPTSTEPREYDGGGSSPPHASLAAKEKDVGARTLSVCGPLALAAGKEIDDASDFKIISAFFVVVVNLAFGFFFNSFRLSCCRRTNADTTKSSTAKKKKSNEQK